PFQYLRSVAVVLDRPPPADAGVRQNPARPARRTLRVNGGVALATSSHLARSRTNAANRLSTANVQKSRARCATTGVGAFAGWGKMAVCRTREGPAMAEYVRRKRPPASHPYWARLHDRAHPPSALLPVAVPGVIGILIGYYGGSRPPYPLSSAVLDACKYAAMFAGVIFVIGGLVTFHDSSRHTPLRERLAASLGSGVLVA